MRETVLHWAGARKLHRGSSEYEFDNLESPMVQSRETVDV